MVCEKQRFGSVTLNKVRNSTDLKRVLRELHLNGNLVVIKPNWVLKELGSFTDCEALRMLLEALDAKSVVTEGYQITRVMNNHDRGMEFIADGKKADWQWLREDDGWRWLQRQTNWDWFKNGGHWNRIRKLDRRFLDECGFTDLFNEYGVEYVNVTEELWKGRKADPKEIEDAVASKFAPISERKLYECVPQKLYELRGADFISFAKLKNTYFKGTTPSFTMKNFFGLIPDPLRSWWHKSMAKNLIDITKIYAALFKVYGICEGIHYARLYNRNHESGGEGQYNLYENLGFVASGQNLVSIDSVLCGLVVVDPNTLPYLHLGQEIFGAYDRSSIEAAKAAAPNWLPFRT